jgi:nucleoside-diphosphate-sugar epimerase
MQTVLITGANGFVGSHILETMSQRDDLRVIAACRNAEKLPSFFDGEIRAGDLRDDDYLDHLLDGVDVVCHTASWGALWGHEHESEELYLQPTLRLLDKLTQSSVKRFLFVSTTSAAAPLKSADALYPGIMRKLWPHMCTIIKIENAMRARANDHCAMVTLRIGLFAGKRYNLSILPILLPRLRTHLVPWVKGGKTSMPIISGEDIGLAFSLAATADNINGYEAFNIVGPEVPTARDVITFIHEEFGYPKPHFSVPFFMAYPFARLMELIDPIVPWEPLVTRSIIHLLEEVGVNNDKAGIKLGYKPKVGWKQAIREQVNEMDLRQTKPMHMYCPLEN